MRRRIQKLLVLATLTAGMTPGCAGRWSAPVLDPDLEYFKSASLRIEYPDVDSETFLEVANTAQPITVEDVPTDYWDLTLDEAIKNALANSEVLRDLGGLVLQSPDQLRTTLGPSVTETDPRSGVEAALAAFDANFRGSAFLENNDRALNNVFFGGGTRLLKQDLHAYELELAKTTATGGRFALRKVIDYDFNNSPGNAAPNLPWTVQLEGEFRQPLLQGAGVDFNQIAGPGGAPGAVNGVLIARINTDISLADFELGIRNLVFDTENAYWELYHAYRDLEAKRAARDRALRNWQAIQALATTGRSGGEADKVARAEEQLYRLEESLQTALVGVPQERFRTTTFRGAGGVHASERRLRLLMGAPINDGRLIRPSEDPPVVKVVFDWGEVLAEALSRRVELRKQKWRIAQRELELAASRNFLLPQVDVVGRYRFRGLGHDLINAGREPRRFDNAVQDLTTGDFQEGALGLELFMPIGFRQAHAAVRNAELLLARDRSVLREQERDVTHDLSTAIAELARAYESARNLEKRREAASRELAALEDKYQFADQQEKTRLLEELMSAQQRLSDSESRYYQARIEYALAVRGVHMQKGSLLDYNRVFMAEGPWPADAYDDADELDASRANPLRALDRLISTPRPLSRGEVPQRIVTDQQPE